MVIENMSPLPYNASVLAQAVGARLGFNSYNNQQSGAASYSRDIQIALDTHKSKLLSYKLYIDYYEGFHRLNFASAKWRSVFGGLFNQFADNLCAPIIDAAADRLKINSFTVTADPSSGNSNYF